jgi:hypothetical protein
MNENLRSILVGTAGLSVAAVAALLLTLLRPPADDRAGRERTARIFLLGLAVQSLHFMEEFVTGFEQRFPVLLGLPAWSEGFFVTFNLTWIGLWILSAVGLQNGGTGPLSSRCGSLPSPQSQTGSPTRCWPSSPRDISPASLPLPCSEYWGCCFG